MPTYSIVAVTVNDERLFRQYVEGHTPTLEKYGGRFLVAGADFETIEGQWPGQLAVVHEWPHREAFHTWYNSDDYKPWKEMRFASAVAKVILSDGV